MTSKKENDSLHSQKDPIQHNNSLLNNDHNTSNSIIENEDIVTPTSSSHAHNQPIPSIVQHFQTYFNDYYTNQEFFCLICDHPHQRENTLINEECKHYVCIRCAKFFFEEKIEQGESNITCPKFSCKTKISTKILQSLVSSMHFKAFTKLQSNKSQTDKEILEYQLQTDQIKIYVQPHVIDINDNEMFYLYHNRKSQFCTKCGENALFTKSGSHKIKCLNCSYSICRYCFKEFNFDHMNLDSENHCKLYFRKPRDQNNQMSCCKNYLTELLFTIASFFMVFIGYYMWLHRCMEKIFCKGKGCCCYSVVIIISIIFFFIGFPFI